MRYIALSTCREGYNVQQAEDYESALTVGELIEVLSQYDENTKVYFCNDHGYTYGSVTEDCIDEDEYEEEEEDEE